MGIVRNESISFSREPALADQLADITASLNISAVFGGATVVFSTTWDPSETAFKKMPDLREWFFPFYLDSDRVITNGARTCTLSKRGKITFSATVDNNTQVVVWCEYCISDIMSLRSLKIAVPFDAAYIENFPTVGRCELYESTTKLAERYAKENSPVRWDREAIVDLTDAKFRVIIGEATFTTTIQALYLGTYKPICIIPDFKNKYENALYAIMIGGVAGGVTAAGAEFVTSKLKQVPGFSQALAASGLSLLSVVGDILAVYTLLVTDGIRNWSDFDFELFTKIFASLTSGIAGIGGLASIALSGFAAQYLPDRIGSAASAAMQVGGNIAVTSAILTTLSTLERYYYP